MKLVPLNPENALADELQSLVDRIRSGELSADAAVIVMRNGRDQMMHAPAQLGRLMNHTEVMGLLSYGTHHYYHKHVIEDAS